MTEERTPFGETREEMMARLERLEKKYKQPDPDGERGFQLLKRIGTAQAAKQDLLQRHSRVYVPKGGKMAGMVTANEMELDIYSYPDRLEDRIQWMLDRAEDPELAAKEVDEILDEEGLVPGLDRMAYYQNPARRGMLLAQEPAILRRLDGLNEEARPFKTRPMTEEDREFLLDATAQEWANSLGGRWR